MEQMQAQETIFGAFSGYGGHCPEGIPVEFGLLTILAAFGVAFGILYRALTLKVGRRRRSVTDGGEREVCDDITISGFVGCQLEQFMEGKDDSPVYHLADILWHGELIFESVKKQQIIRAESNTFVSYFVEVLD